MRKPVRLLGISWEGGQDGNLNFLPPAERFLFGVRLEKKAWQRWARFPGEVRRLRKALATAELVLLPSRSWALWRRPFYQRPRGWFRWARVAGVILRDPSRLTEAMLPWTLARRGIPTVLVDRGDQPSMGYPNFFAHQKARRTYLRELPVDHHRAFGANYNGEEVPIAWPWKRKERLEAAKLEPISIGIPDETAERIQELAGSPEPGEKKWDLFYAGQSINWERGRVQEDLRRLGEAGFRVRHCAPLPFEEYVRTMAHSWLVLSPPGNGYDCYRHYEVPLAGSVPLMAVPTIFRYRPLRHGREAWNYQPDAADLVAVVRRALRDKERLIRMSRAGCHRVLRYHRWSRLVEHIRQEAAGLVSAAD